MGKGAMAVTDSLKEYHAQTVAPYTPTSLLLTGGTGFIGSHVAVRLAKTFPDAKIIVIDRMDYVSSVSHTYMSNTCVHDIVIVRCRTAELVWPNAIKKHSW